MIVNKKKVINKAVLLKGVEYCELELNAGWGVEIDLCTGEVTVIKNNRGCKENKISYP